MMAYFKNLLSTGLTGLALLTCAVVPARASAAPTTLDGGMYGDVVLAKPTGQLRAFIVLYSGRDGWRDADQDAAELLARNGALVIGVDMPRYAAKLALTHEDKRGCHYLVDEAEKISQQLQREAHSTRYFRPLLVGVGQGGALAASTLARAPTNTLAGAVLLNADARLDPRVNPCVPAEDITHVKGFPGFIENGVTTGAAAVSGSKASAGLADAADRPVSYTLPAPRHFAQGTTEAEAILAMVKPHLLAPGIHDDDNLSDLPLIELPSSQPSDLLAIVISGDGGWRDLDKTVAESLQREGVQVLGIDALRYFWSAKTPEQTSRDVARVIRVYGARWHTRHIALVGYSFGASVLPFVYNRLPAEMRAQVSQLSLLGFATMADFQIRVTGWLGLPASTDALPALPEAVRVPTALMQCFYGAEETHSACPELAKRGVAVVKTPGGHHFGENYDELARTILTRWRAQIGATPGR